MTGTRTTDEGGHGHSGIGRTCGSRRSADAVRVRSSPRRAARVRAGRQHPAAAACESMSRPAAIHAATHRHRGAGGPRRRRGPGARHLRAGAHPAQRRRPGPGHRAVDRAALPARARHPGRPAGRRRRAGPHPRGRPLVRPGDAAAGAHARRRPRRRPARPRPAAALPPARARRWRAARPARPAGARASTGLRGAVPRGARGPGCALLDDRLGAGGRVARLPVAVPLGLAIAFAARPAPAGCRPTTAPQDAAAAPPLRPLAARGRRRGGRPGRRGLRASTSWPAPSGRRLATVLPGGPQVWRLATHASMPSARSRRARRWSGRGRCGRSRPGRRPRSRCSAATRRTRWTGPTLSGGPDSLVPWDTLGKEGRAPHAHPRAPGPACPTGRPGVPDLSIETVMGEPAVAAPVQVYVGLDSAPTARERVDLALAEMERTGAFDRSLLVLRLADRAGLRQLRRRGRGPVPHARRRRHR